MWQQFPMITCPHCNQEFQVDDYGCLAGGDTFTCIKCEKDIYIVATDIIMEVDVQGTP